MRKNLLTILAALALTACSVGPDYVKPSAEVPTQYKETHPPDAPFKETKGWKVAQPGDPGLSSTWWELFGDPQLNALESQVEISNQNIKEAEANFRQARALVREARSGYFPTVTTSPSVTRSRTPGGSSSGRSGAGATFTDFNLPADATWEIDIWGRVRRAVEGSRGRAEASAADLAAVRLSAQAELARNYFLLRVQDTQQRLLDATVANYQKALELTRNRYDSGVAARAEVLQAETQLQSTKAQALDLQVQRAQLEHAIALLIGKSPASFSLKAEELKPTFPVIPVALPSQLLERRPDIAAAERRMAAANADIGVAKAAYFPSLSISASAGFQALSAADWLLWPSRFWSIGTSLGQVLFDGGLRRARSEEAVAAYEANVAAYRQSVLVAFQEVEDNLVALRVLEEEAKVQEAAVVAARQSVDVSLNQYRAGTISYLNVVVTQYAALNNERAAVDILGRRLAASVGLVKALGGGWSSGTLSAEGRNARP
ncbi:efflux transporter outer membrane subunit [Geomonas sp. RF6]|uniref:efflux transporter outer membrane subunit n=1 Tax=Geomonas sp. RF6 TaxID=2897342 RepID=UPI001E3199FA|nr:efflux transporter outer membrane subunit [Geomonas sp. RF6]UFS69215.1 efflux transporter outer membrane subunit [Geomonas sp. RF6]